MSRKVFVKVQVNMILDMEEGVDVEDVLCDMDYSFHSQTENADIVDIEIEDWDIFDSK